MFCSNLNTFRLLGRQQINDSSVFRRAALKPKQFSPTKHPRPNLKPRLSTRPPPGPKTIIVPPNEYWGGRAGGSLSYRLASIRSDSPYPGLMMRLSETPFGSSNTQWGYCVHFCGGPERCQHRTERSHPNLPAVPPTIGTLPTPKDPKQTENTIAKTPGTTEQTGNTKRFHRDLPAHPPTFRSW